MSWLEFCARGLYIKSVRKGYDEVDNNFRTPHKSDSDRQPCNFCTFQFYFYTGRHEVHNALLFRP